MRHRLFPFLGTALVALVFATPTSAQYIYIDTNGDGLHTGADVISPTGQTALDVWVVTDANRDGSAATCSSEDGDLTISSYEFNLQTANGTARWVAFTNRQPGFGASIGETSSPTDYHNGRLVGAALPPGRYWLASVTLEVATGTPSVAFVATNGTYTTSFYSGCSGSDLDNTLKLGSDWFDADGAPFGGAANQPPVLIPPSDMSVAEGATLSQEIRADDADGNEVSFRLASGPHYVTVSTTDPGSGHAAGRIDLAPGYADEGTAAATIEASDGFASDQSAFGITVTHSGRAPVLIPPHDDRVLEGDQVIQVLAATDPDLDVLTFSLVSGPSYVTVTPVGQGPPALALATIAPGFTASGVDTVVVSVSDGVFTDEASFSVVVIEAFDYIPPILLSPVDMTAAAGSTADQRLIGRSPSADPVSFVKLAGPAFMTVSTLSTAPDGAAGMVHLAPGPADAGGYEVEVGAVAGSRMETGRFWITVAGRDDPPPVGPTTFGAPFYSAAVGNFPEDAAIGDLNGDGNADLVSADLFGHTLTMVFGNGDGTFSRRQTYEVGGSPFAAAIGDVNRDGMADVVFADSSSSVITVLPGEGSGLFGARTDYSTGSRPAYVSLYDVSQDGILDMVVPNEDDNSVSVFLGQTDGTFARRTDYRVGHEPCQLSVGDLNADGVPDVVVVNEESNSLSVLLGVGGGVLAPHVEFGTGEQPRTVEIGDLNEDGIPDLAVPNFSAATISVLIGLGGGTFSTHQDYASGPLPWGLVLSDLNRDGHLDIAVANTGSNDLAVMLGDGTGRFEVTSRLGVGNSPRTVRAGDINHDRWPDLVVDSENANALSIHLGRGDGSFGLHEVLPGEGFGGVPIVEDVNRDGFSDLVLLHRPSSVLIQWGKQGGGISGSTELEVGADPYRATLGDWNGDGLTDLAVTSLTGRTMSVFLGVGGNAFGSRTNYEAGSAPTTIESGELNGDGFPDLVLTDWPVKTLLVFRGLGDGRFVPAAGQILSGTPSGFAVGDWDGDGVEDVAVGEWGPGGLSLLLGSRNGDLVAGPRVSLDRNVSGVAFGDLDGDGRLEIWASIQSRPGKPGGLGVFRRAPDGTLTGGPERSAGRDPGGILIDDLNGDGAPEIVVSDFSSRAMSVFAGGKNGVPGVMSEFGGGEPGVGDWTGDGSRDLLVWDFGKILVLPNRGPHGVGTVTARCYTTPENGVTRLMTGKPATCVQVEPVNGSFEIADVDPSSIVMRSSGTGDVEEIQAVIGKGSHAGDRDGNGVLEVTACFARTELTRLFSKVRGRAAIPVTIRGTLLSGPRFEARLDLDVIGGGSGALRASVSPNPFNPTATLRIGTITPGALRVRVFDTSGRLVKTLVDERMKPAGDYDFRIEAGGAHGGGLASGIYYYLVEASGEKRTGRFAIVK